MKKRLLIPFFRIFFFFTLMLSGLVCFMLNPQVLFASGYKYGQLHIYASPKYNGGQNDRFDKAISLIRKSELYHSSFQIDVFLNGAKPVNFLLTHTMGDAYAWGYYNNVVINGAIDERFEWNHLRKYQRHFSRTLAHEMIHCLQSDQLGPLHSRPLKKIPIWKWEGYPEYISYLSAVKNEKQVLIENIRRFAAFKKSGKTWIEVEIDEGKSYTSIDYMKAWLMIKYLLDIKGMTYRQILKDEIKEETVFNEMINWLQQVSITK
ncbi:MAG: hypothetical protein HYX40_05450 [Sphingobacteriales bacterium]|nr:hypothetical protein [Sphingobacteriales bacterium]